MLVMRRRAGEGFLIGVDIEIDILEVSPTRVKIGIVAPDALQIVRKEVVLTRQENLTASRTAPPQTIAWLSRTLSKPRQGASAKLTAVKDLTDSIRFVSESTKTNL
jgi:carbon storage regulator CsrA